MKELSIRDKREFELFDIIVGNNKSNEEEIIKLLNEYTAIVEERSAEEEHESAYEEGYEAGLEAEPDEPDDWRD